MTTTRISDIVDQLITARDEAIVKVGQDAKWIVKIDAAYDWLLQQDDIESYDGTVLMPSDTSDTVYSANGHCNCTAGQNGQMCKHRIRARLFKNALSIQEREAAAKAAAALAAQAKADAKAKARAAYELALKEINELFV